MSARSPKASVQSSEKSMTFTCTSLSWIQHQNHANNKCDSSTKSRVFRHVAAHRKLKRQQSTQRLRASALNVLKTLRVPVERTQSISSPSVGSIDPFDTLPIPLTAAISNLLQFDRVHLSPAVNISKFRLHPSGTYLQDELAVYGYLARIALIKYRCWGHTADLTLMLDMKTEAMGQLRRRLPQTPLTRLPLAVMALLFTETWCRNADAAIIHVRLLEVINGQHGLDVDDLICVLHSDVQRACMTLEDTMFTMGDDSWDLYDTDSGQEHLGSGQPTSAHDYYPLRSLDWLRQGLAVLDLLSSVETTPNIRRAASMKCLRIMSMLLHCFNRSSDLVEKYTALAVLYRLRLKANMERMPLCKITIFDGGKVILPRLRALLVAAVADPPALHLWALSVGMMSGDNWFSSEYEKCAKIVRSRLHKPTGEILSRFEERGPPVWNRSVAAELLQSLGVDGQCTPHDARVGTIPDSPSHRD